MASEKATGLVLRVVDFSETSCIVSVFTREFGKIQGLAKGGRRLKGPFESALDLLALVRLVFLRKSSGLDLLTEAKLERRFRGRDRDLASIYAGYYVAELLGALTDEYDPHPRLFDLANATLVGLCTSENLSSQILRFELGALSLLGHLPTLSVCAECGKSVEMTGRMNFSQRSGGVLCRTCRPGRRQVISVSAGVIRALERFADADSGTWQRMELDRRTHGELRGVMNHYFTHLIGQRPKMQRYLDAPLD
jgi:DNA repair protein RecO (recombination protein O)